MPKTENARSSARDESAMSRQHVASHMTRATCPATAERECWPIEEKAKRAACTVVKVKEKVLLQHEEMLCCAASNMEHFSNASRLWRSLSNQKWLSKCDAIFGDFDFTPESRNFLNLAYSEACCAISTLNWRCTRMRTRTPTYASSQNNK